jgi:hypothetical protein
MLPTDAGLFTETVRLNIAVTSMKRFDECCRNSISKRFDSNSIGP